MGTYNTHHHALEYRTYLENNIQYIHQITKNIEKLILRLEKEYISISECFKLLDNEITILLKIYSHFTSLGGYDYLLKLKSLVKKYQTVKNEEIQLSALYYIHSKILTLQEEQLKHFPDFAEKKSLFRKTDNKENIVADEMLQSCPYKWITFTRNSMFFIVTYDSFEIKSISDFDDISIISNNLYTAVQGNVTLTIRDPLRLDEKPSPNILCIIFHGRIYGYFFDAIGKKLGSKKDVLTRIIYKTSTHIDQKLWYGRIHLFGNSFLYLKHIDMSVQK